MKLLFMYTINVLIMDPSFAIPQLKYNMSYTSCPGSFYARDEMKRLVNENAQLKEAVYRITGRRWGDDLGPGKFTDDGKFFMPLDTNERRVGQLTVCMNVMANVIAEYLTHLKKCAMPYMEAYYRNDYDEIRKHHQAFMPNHVKSIITFQKYVQAVINDAERDPDEFEKMMYEHSQEELIHEELESSYNMHYKVIPEIQKTNLKYKTNEDNYKVSFTTIPLSKTNETLIPNSETNSTPSPLEGLDKLEELD